MFIQMTLDLSGVDTAAMSIRRIEAEVMGANIMTAQVLMFRDTERLVLVRPVGFMSVLREQK